MPKVRQVLARVKKVELKTDLWVEGLISGEYRSVFKGRGIEFSEVREYLPGDDVRSIDWNVTARLNEPFVKEFIEERDLNIYVVFDLSASNNFGSVKSKKEAGVELAASVMLSAVRNNDNVGMCLFTDRIERFFPPRKGRKNALRLLRELIYYEPKSRGTDVKGALDFIGKVVKKRSVIFVVSDYFSDSFEKPLKILKNRHDVILVNLQDAIEEELPDMGYVYLEDEETGEQVLVDTSDEDFRKAYAKEMRANSRTLEKGMKKLNIDVVWVRTDEPFYVPLRRFFGLRERRVSR